MDLVERYIEAVKFWLPKKTKEDIAAELRDDIRSEIEEAERAKGLPLGEDEVADILKARGTPLSVANRYLPRHALIGPELFPLYIFVLKVVVAICFIPQAIMWVWAAFEPGTVRPGMYSVPINSLLVSFALVTIIFAVIEHKGINPAKLQSFNPRNLPPVLDRNRIRRSESVGDIIGGLIVIGFYLAGYLSVTTYTLPPNIFIANELTFLHHIPHGHITVSPVWIPYWQIIVAIAAVKIAASAVNMFKPYWSVPRAILRLALDVATVAAIYWLLSSNLLREFVMPGLPADAIVQFFKLSAWAAALARPIACVLILIFVIKAVWRITQVSRAHVILSPTVP